MFDLVLVMSFKIAANGLGLCDGVAIEFLQPNPCTKAKLKN
jgi:hypothetical protein